jgi:hypothetical protein
MPPRSEPCVLLRLCFFVFVFSAFAYLNPTSAQTCDGDVDTRIVSSIYTRIKNDRSLAAQLSHINVVALYGAVKLQGWTDTAGDYDKVYRFALETDCARLINVSSLEKSPPPADSGSRSGGGCASGTKACGDVCIPAGDTCNITASAKAQ